MVNDLAGLSAGSSRYLPLLSDQALGDQALGDQALGDQALGDQALGDQALGDQVLRTLPPLAQRMVVHAGIAPALRACRELGGRKIHLSDRPRQSRITAILGAPAVKALAAEMGNGSVDCPSCRPFFRRLFILRLRRQGRSIAQIQAVMGLTERRVRQILSSC